jgi:hypothetical protein
MLTAQQRDCQECAIPRRQTKLKFTTSLALFVLESAEILSAVKIIVEVPRRGMF